MITRRKFLLSTFGILGASGLAIYGFGRSGIEAAIVALLRKRLDYLKMDSDGLHAFASDQATKILAKRVSTARLKYHFAAAVESSSSRFQRSTATGSRLQRAEDVLVRTYLISSDFFANGADESKLIRYVAYYDPMRACSNPFARPVIIETTLDLVKKVDRLVL
jgi:hypothetical protein